MNNKIHVPKQFIVAFNAFKDTEDFYDLAAQSVGSKILYAFLTAFLCCLLSYGITTFKIANDDDLAGYINAIPEFTYANGQLKLDQTYSNDDRESEVYIYGNTDWESIYLQSNSSAPTQNAIALDNQLQQLISSNQYKKFLIFSKTNFMIVDLEKVQGNYQEMSYADMASLFKVYSLTKSDIMNGYKGVIYKFGGIIGLIMLPVLTIGMFFISLLLSLVGLIVSNVTNNKEDFNTIYWITFYIYSCMALMSNFANAVFNHGFKISLFIFYIYMIKRILDRGEMGLDVIRQIIPIQLPENSSN